MTERHVFTCDRCGAEVDLPPADAAVTFPGDWRRLKLLSPDFEVLHSAADVCPACVSSFQVWMDEGVGGPPGDHTQGGP